MTQDTLIELRDVTITLQADRLMKPLVNSLSLEIPSQSITALVGGSGSGKTTTGLAILRLLSPALSVAQGAILFGGDDLLKIPDDKMRRIRGKDIAMIFQEPLTAFNPVFTIGYQIDEVLKFHTNLSKDQRKTRVEELLHKAGITDIKRTEGSYPHQLSGGMRQRAMIAQAIAADPQLIIADEPTSSLDVTLQARIMELFRNLVQELGLSMLLISHDLGMVSHLADRVAVITDGRIVEEGVTGEVLNNPRHEYTQRLMGAM